jgi:hypothetical protein
MKTIHDIFPGPPLEVRVTMPIQPKPKTGFNGLVLCTLALVAVGIWVAYQVNKED